MAARNPQLFNTVELGPLSGQLDTRSLPHEVAYNGFRWSESMAVNSAGKVCRRPGYERLHSEASPYNNQDLHDQLSASIDEPITLLYEAVSTTGIHRLIAGTQTRLYAANDATGNWTLLSDNLGGTGVAACSDRVWFAAQGEDTLVFTNGFDKPQYWTFDAGPGISEINDLNTLNVTRAQVVGAWKGLVFLANVTADGVRVPHRIMWSDFRKPLSFKPVANSSVAGFHDLGYGEDILGMAVISDSLLVYTLHGIWEAQVTGDASVLSFRQRYAEPLTGTGCLAYKRTLISTGDAHMYFGRDGIYYYDLYQFKPVRVDWIYRASGVVFDELETSLCGLHVAGWNPSKREAWFSWAKSGDTARCPYRTLVVNTEYQFCDIVNKGFTAFSNFSPTPATSLRDFIVNRCICTNTQLEGQGDDFAQDSFCVAPSDPSCPTPIGSIFSQTPYTWNGVETEDFTGAPDGDSLCATLGSSTLEQLCAEEQATAACSAAQRFVMASSEDKTLKQYGGIYAYEVASSHVACGAYSLHGYDSILRSGPIDFKVPNAEKMINRFWVNHIAEEQTIPTNLQVRLGFARQPSDPNVTNCPIMWRTLPPKPLACASSKTEAQHISDHTRPYLAMEWPLLWGGRFVYWEIKVSGTGGAACFSNVGMNVQTKAVNV